MTRRRVAVVALGGTIAMTPADANGGVTPTLRAEDLVHAVPELADVATVEAVSFRNLPGAHLGLDDLTALAAHLQRLITAGCDGVVVTQGTDTLEETAFGLDLLTHQEAPIVLTGAMRHPTQPGADGAANLLSACRIASSSQAQGCGVLVVLDDTIHAARFVGKWHASRPSAFASASAGPLGWVAEDRVRIPLRPRARVQVPVPEGAALPRVPVVMATVGDELVGLDRVEADGLVVEALGAGHLPAKAAHRIGQLAQHLPILLVSRTRQGEVFRKTYGFPGSERDLLARGALPGGFLDGPKARLLLTFALAAGWDRPKILSALEELG